MSTSLQRTTSVIVAPSTIRRGTTSSAIAPVPTLSRVLPSADPATTAQVSRLVPAASSIIPVATTPLPLPGTALSRPTTTISTSGVLPSSAAAIAPAPKGISTTTLIAIIVPAVLVVCAIIGYCVFRRQKKSKKDRYSDFHNSPNHPQNYSTEKLVQSPHSLQSPRSILNPGNDWGNSPTFSSPATYPPPASPALYVSPPPDDRRAEPSQMQWEEERADVKLVKRSFEPTLPDELVIHPGDRVQILTRFSDGWSLGINLDAADQGVVFKGVFPYDCLEDAPTYGGQPTLVAPSNSAANPANLQHQHQHQQQTKPIAPINALYNATPLPAPLGPLPSPTPLLKTTTPDNVGYFPSPSPNGTYHPTSQQHASSRIRGPTPPNASTPRSNIPNQSPQLDPFPRESSPFMTIDEEDENYGSRTSNAATGLGISSPPRSNGGRQRRLNDSPPRENGNGRAGGNQKRTSSLLRKNGNGGGRSDREKEMLDALSGL